MKRIEQWKSRNKVVIYHAMTWPQMVGMWAWILVMIGIAFALTTTK